MDRWRCVAVSAGVGVQECGSAGAGEQLCRSSCAAAVPVQLCRCHHPLGRDEGLRGVAPLPGPVRLLGQDPAALPGVAR